MVIDLEKCLKYLDYGTKGHRICEIFLQYLQDEVRPKEYWFESLEWTHYSMKPHEIPQQLNGSDCGMFTCKYADYIFLGQTYHLLQHQMPLRRRWCGNLISSCCEKLCLIPSSCWWFFGHFHTSCIVEAKSPCIFCFSTELSKCMKAFAP